MEEEEEEEQEQEHPLQPPPASPRRRRSVIWTLAIAGAVIGVVCLVPRKRAGATPLQSEAALPSVAVARVDREDLFQEVSIPGEFRPYVEVELHAKVSGYLDKMNVDFGDRVKAGQLLATLEVPELHDELANARATAQRAEADYTNAHLIYTRLIGVDKEHPNLMAQQDIDTAAAKDAATAAAIAAARADAQKYETLVGYTKIAAPFDGVITRRYVDPGALVEAGTSSDTARPLLRISDNYHLRLDFPVSVAYVKDIRVGDPVDVIVDSLGGKKIRGAITRATLQVNDDTRTMMTEIEVANPNLDLVPGMYASVALQVEHRSQTLAIPIEAVPPGQSSTVYVINDHGEIEERPVTLGLETPSKDEVLSGLKEGELVLIGSRSMVRPGEKVEAKVVGSLAQR